MKEIFREIGAINRVVDAMANTASKPYKLSKNPSLYGLTRCQQVI